MKTFLKSYKFKSLEVGSSIAAGINPDIQKPKANFESNSKAKNWLEKIRNVGNFAKKEAIESIEMLKNMVTNPKQAFIQLGKDLNQIYNITKFNLAKIPEIQNILVEIEKITPKVKYVKQEYPNPIAVSPNGEVQKIGQKTEMVANIGVENGRFEKRNGEFYVDGRHLIGKATKVDGGAYPGSSFEENGESTREIIVANFEKDRAVQLFYNSLISKINNSKDNSIGNIIRIYDKLIIPMINVEKSELLANQYKNQKVQLGLFLMQGGVVCRHNAVLFALMIEKMKENGIIDYPCECTIERHNGNWQGVEGNHAYCKVKTIKNGKTEISISDAMQRRSGKQEKVGRVNPYVEKGDQENYFKKMVGLKIKVLRSDNKVEADWFIKSIKSHTNDHFDDMITVSKIINGQEYTKVVAFDTLRNWQNITANNIVPFSKSASLA